MKLLVSLLINIAILFGCKPVSAPPMNNKKGSKLNTEDYDPLAYTPPSYSSNCPAGMTPIPNPAYGNNAQMNDPYGNNAQMNDPYGNSNCQPAINAGPPKVKNKHIQKCLNVWHAKNVPLPANPTWTELKGGVSVLGFGGGSNLNDRVNTTPNRSIVLIKPSVSVLSSQTWNLLNPMGLYCIKSGTKVLSRVVVNLAAGASLVESSVNVSVLSQNPSGVAGVNVLSDIQVNTIGSAPAGIAPSPNAIPSSGSLPTSNWPN